ncbi:MAG: hypothetical protein ACUVQU_05220 [Candidatus Bipolaricaulia bacterium]
MEGFKKLVLRLERRARLVRGLERARLILSLTLGLILGYQLLRLLGLVEWLQLRWRPWLAFAAFASVAVLGGFLWGYLERVELAGLLFKVDRRLGLHERLSSLYELSCGRGRTEFIPLLAARLPSRLEPAFALPLRKRGWLLPAGLLLAAFFLFEWPHLPISSLFPPPPAREEQEQAEAPGRLGALEEKLRQLEAELGLRARARPWWSASRGSSLLQERLAALEEELWGPSAEPALQGELSAQLIQALPPPEPESEAEASGRATRHATLEELKRLASRLPGGALKELLERLGEAQEQEETGRAEAAEALWRDLALAEALIERLAEAKRRLEGPGQLGLTPGGPLGGEEEGPGLPPPGPGTGGSESEERPPSSEEGAPGGEEAGTTPGSWPSLAWESFPLSWPNTTRELHISGELGEMGEIERLSTRGTPFELGGPEGEPHLRLDFQKVKASLEARKIPSEAQGVVQRYFLIITEE